MAEIRRCIGSERFGIEAHDAPIEAFPKQPSQPGGLGRMCSEHWRAYTRGLSRDAKSRTAAATTEESVTPVAVTPVAVTEEADEEASVSAVTGEAATSEPKRRRRAKSANIADGEEVTG